MPDVQLWHNHRLFQRPAEVSAAQHDIAVIVARQMDCDDEQGNRITHDPERQIDFLMFAPFAGHSEKLIIMHVIAYDWPDRMRNLEERLENIASGVKALLLDPWGPVSVGFIPMPRHGGWVKV